MELDQLVARFRGPLIGLLASQGASWGDAAEISLDCFTEAYLHRSAFRGDPEDLAAVGGWLRGIARNLLRERRRKLRRLPTSSPELDAFPAPDESVVDERRALIRQAMEGLKPTHREIVYMHYFERTSHREVAALLGVSERAVEGRLYKARKVLKVEIERMEHQALAPSARGAERGGAR